LGSGRGTMASSWRWGGVAGLGRPYLLGVLGGATVRHGATRGGWRAGSWVGSFSRPLNGQPRTGTDLGNPTV
jgi:hypothetical protein